MKVTVIIRFYSKINGETEEEANEDAKLFCQLASKFRSDEYNRPILCYEEFLLAMIKISQLHGMKVIDQFIDKSKEVLTF